MQLDKDVRDLAKGVTRGSSILCVIEILLIVLLSVAGLVTFRLTMVLAAIGGTAVVVGCFWWMAVSLQKSLDEALSGGRAVKSGVMAGYGKRLGVQGLWVIVTVVVPYMLTGQMQTSVIVCGLVPLLFARLSIYGIQITGKRRARRKEGEV